jgi:hypothetical protein
MSFVSWIFLSVTQGTRKSLNSVKSLRAEPGCGDEFWFPQRAANTIHWSISVLAHHFQMRAYYSKSLHGCCGDGFWFPQRAENTIHWSISVRAHHFQMRAYYAKTLQGWILVNNYCKTLIVFRAIHSLCFLLTLEYGNVREYHTCY